MTALIGRLLGCGFEADTVTTPLQGLKSPTDAPILALRVVVTSAGLLIGPPVGEHEPDGRVPTLPHFILQGGRQPMMIGGPFRGPPCRWSTAEWRGGCRSGRCRRPRCARAGA